MLGAVKTRLEARVPELNRRVELAANLAELMRRKRLPTAPLAAYVVPVGLRGERPEVVTGSYRQPVQETLSVVLFARSGTPDGERALTDISALIRNVIHAIAGWTPTDTVGLFHFVQSGVMSWEDGVLIYQFQFAISDHVRIFS